MFSSCQEQFILKGKFTNWSWTKSIISYMDQIWGITFRGFAGIGLYDGAE